MFGTAGRGAPCARATRSLVVRCMRTQTSYSPPASPKLCLFKAPTAAVGVQAQDLRQGPWNHQGAGLALSYRDRSSHEHRPQGPGSRESGQDSGRHWERVVTLSLAIL